MTTARKPYPSDVSDEEWALVVPYLTLLRDDAGRREHPRREVFNGYLVKTGAPWRWMPQDLPPWAAVDQPAQRWLEAGCFEQLTHDLRAVLRLAAGRAAEPSAAVLDSRTLRSTPESGTRAGYDGAKRKRGAKLHMAVDTLGPLLALHVTPATVDDRAEVGRLAAAPQEATGESIELAHVDQGYMGEKPAAAARGHGIKLEVVRPPEAKRGFVLLPRRPPWPPGHGPCGDGAGACCAGWPAERIFAWTTRFRRLVRDDERLPQTLADLPMVALVRVMLRQAANYAAVHNSL